MGKIRNLVVVFGDQLNAEAAVFDGFRLNEDAVWMAEAADEAEHVWSHKQRIAVFLAAMRHFRQRLEAAGRRVFYSALDDCEEASSLGGRLRADLRRMGPERVLATRPGEWRVLRQLEAACGETGVELELFEDGSFYTTPEGFRNYAEGRKTLRMEYFYRALRKRFSVLMDGKSPAGGAWNFDRDNRGTFGKEGPPAKNPGPGFEPDKVTREVLQLVEERFAGHPGNLETFAWPVTPADAQTALERFVRERLPNFGRYQDAMWTNEPWLYHSWLSVALNLKLLDPREAVGAAETAYRSGVAPLAAVEGFIRQILGWREYVRGIYWMKMPEYLERNTFHAGEDLPGFYWSGETHLSCLRQAVGQTLEFGYAHHIQRLMVTGLYALLLGVDPKQVHAWYLAVYVDAVEWVELPNTLGMSQYADGGLMASKPYAATGKYIKRMSNYCASCPKNPDQRLGEKACPFTTLYWDFLLRHEETLQENPRMGPQLRNLERIGDAERKNIRAKADSIRKNPAVG